MTIKFYKLIKENECIYIGETGQKYLCNRMSNHRQSFQRWKDGTARKHYYFT
jgi:hypothetical protein